MAEKKERVVFIDVLKGFAIICVVLGHIVDGYYKSNLYPEQNNFFWMLFVIIYSFHMSLFFMLSGYLYGMVYIKESIQHFKISRQIKRLAYVYCVWCFLMWGFKILFKNWVNNEVQVIDIVLIPIKAIEPYWYLYVLIILYAVFSSEQIQKIKWKKVLAFLGIISMTASWMPIVHWFEITRLLYFSFFFFFGQCVAQKRIILNIRTIAFGIIAGCLSFVFYPMQIDKIGGISLICALGVSVALFWIFQNSKKYVKKSKILQVCGKYSLEIYVMHCFLTAFFRVALHRIQLSFMPLNILVNLILSVAVPMLVATCMKKIRIYDFFFAGSTLENVVLKKRGNNI